MKEYQSITDRVHTDIDIVAFGKLDGSNIRAEWTQKRGFDKFGTRRRLLDEKATKGPGLGHAVTLFKETWGKVLPTIFMKQRWLGKDVKITCFFEYYGPNSFAGWHSDPFEDRKLTLIDVNLHKKGILSPKEFIDLFGHLDIPKILYRGKANQTFIDSVRNSTLEDMPFEGVVCKAPNPSKKKTAKPVMFKIKSQAWYDKLLEKCDGDTKQFDRLK